MELNVRPALGLALLALAIILFSGAYFQPEIPKQQEPYELARLDGGAVYTGISVPDGETVHFSREMLLQGNLLCVSTENAIPSDMPVQQARNVRKMVGLYVPAAQDVSLSEETIYALCDLCTENQLIRTWIVSGMRAPSEQHALQDAAFEAYRQTMTTQAALNAARRDVPDSGRSEHQLATAFDVQFTGALDWSKADPLERSADGIWLRDNSWRFGFIRRYPPEKAYITGVSGEERHFRYVGPEHAFVMQATGWCLEEYLQALKQHACIAIEKEGAGCYILSSQMDESGAEFSVPAGYACAVSADNLGNAVCVLRAVNP